MPSQAIVNQSAENKVIGPGRYKNTSLDRQKFTKRALAMKNEGLQWHSAWKDIQKYIVPTRGFFDPVSPNQGQKIDHTNLIDGHGGLAVDIMASGMLSGLSSKSRPWFKLALADFDLMEYSPVKIWLDEVTKRMYSILAKSNTYGALHGIYTELASFATACCFLEEDFWSVIRCRGYTAGEYVLSSDSKGKVNGFYRRFWMTVGQMVREFGLENLNPTTQASYQGNQPEIWKTVNLLIEENDDRVPFLRDYANMPFRSIYWEDGADATSFIKLGGYEEFPLLAPRWETATTSDVYGKGPGWKALGDIKMLQQIQKEKFIALAKVGNPPLQRDASVQGEVMNMPGGITAFSAMLPNAGLKPAYQVNPDVNALREDIRDVKSAINRYFFADLFVMFIEAARQGREVTATEIIEKQSEKLSMLGPVIDKTEEEVHNPLITRLFNIMSRNMLIPQPPEEIQGMEIVIQYVSILAQAQKMMNVAAVDQWSVGVMNDAAIDPSAADILNLDEKHKAKADMLGVPAKIVRSPEEMAAIRKARAKQQQIAAQQQMMLAMAEAAAKGGKAVKDVSEAAVGTGSVLDSISGAAKGMGFSLPGQ